MASSRLELTILGSWDEKVGSEAICMLFLLPLTVLTFQENVFLPM